jgi:hypothetical protein
MTKKRDQTANSSTTSCIGHLTSIVNADPDDPWLQYRMNQAVAEARKAPPGRKRAAGKEPTWFTVGRYAHERGAHGVAAAKTKWSHLAEESITEYRRRYRAELAAVTVACPPSSTERNQ